jgi:hypothetical protein
MRTGKFVKIMEPTHPGVYVCCDLETDAECESTGKQLMRTERVRVPASDRCVPKAVDA